MYIKSLIMMYLSVQPWILPASWSWFYVLQRPTLSEVCYLLFDQMTIRVWQNFWLWHYCLLCPAFVYLSSCPHYGHLFVCYSLLSCVHVFVSCSLFNCLCICICCKTYLGILYSHLYNAWKRPQVWFLVQGCCQTQQDGTLISLSY